MIHLYAYVWVLGLILFEKHWTAKTEQSHYFSLHLKSWVLLVQNIAVFDIQSDLLGQVISVWLRVEENLNFISYPFDEI